MNGRHLDDALRALPRREGRSDWSDLEARISALKPARPPRHRLFTRRRVFSAMGTLALLVGAFATWNHMTTKTADAFWQEAHRDATVSDPWADPWVAAAMETSP